MSRVLDNRSTAAPRRVIALVLSSMALLGGRPAPGTASATTTTAMGAGLPATPEPSFTPRTVVPTGSGFAAGRLQVALHVKPGCAIVLPRGGELAQMRLQCSDSTVWLAHLVPQRASEPMRGRRDVAFVPLRFEHQPDGFRPYPEGQGNADTPMLTPPSGIRFNLDY
jgi:hypothetical protein